MTISYQTQYVSIGANRFSSVSSADPNTGVIAFGGGRVVGLWDPRVSLVIAKCQQEFARRYRAHISVACLSLW
jgi:hypothetical protein